METYEVMTNEFGSLIKRTNKNGSETWIPKEPSNSDYQAYLASLNADSEGNL